MKTSTLNISTGFAGDGWPNAQPWVSGPIVNTPSSVFVQSLVLTSGSTTAIPVPLGSLWLRLAPNPGSTLTKVFKTVSGDTGTNFSKTQPFVFVFDQANLPANVYVALGAGGTTENIDVEFG